MSFWQKVSTGSLVVAAIAILVWIFYSIHETDRRAAEYRQKRQASAIEFCRTICKRRTEEPTSAVGWKSDGFLTNKRLCFCVDGHIQEIP